MNYAATCVCGRRVLEMCCFMEKMLASMLADFEMKVEKDVLEPLNKLSEVIAACLHPLSCLLRSQADLWTGKYFT